MQQLRRQTGAVRDLCVAPAVSVFRVPDQRVPSVFQVGTDLMAASGDQFHLDQRIVSVRVQGPRDGLDRFAFGGRFRQHADLIRLLVLQQPALQVQFPFQRAADDREVIFRKTAVLCECSAQRPERLGVLAEHDEARRVAVQPVDGGRHEALLQPRHVIPFFDQIVHDLVRERILLLGAVPVDQQAEGLADDQHVFVLAGDGELPLGGRPALLLRQRVQIRVGQIELQHVPFREKRLLFRPFSVDFYIFADSLIDQAERGVAQVFLQEAVQPLSCVVCGDRYFSHN